MRFMIPAFATLVFATAALSAQAQTPAPSPVPAPGAVAPAVPGARQTKLDQRFAAANTTHDGRLTLDQAKAAKWRMVVRNFPQIDTGNRGYVTQADIRAAAQAARAAKVAGQVPQKS